VELLYDPMFVPNDLHKDHDTERVMSTPKIWQKLTRTAPERYVVSLVAMIDRYKDRNRTSPIFELILTLQNLEQKLPPSHASISAICHMTERLDKMEKKQDGMLEELSLLINCDEPVVVSETTDENQNDQKSLLKELIKLIKISAIKGKHLPVQANDSSKSMSRAAL